MMVIYTRLSQVYDLGWGDFPTNYVSLITGLLQEQHINRAKVLDLACGTGILAIELARKGHIVKGIDISPEMIRMAKSKSTGLANVSFEVADMTRLQAEDTYHLVMCTFDSINYITRISDLRKMFRFTAQALRHKGIFIFDSNTRKLYRSHHNDRVERELGGQTFIQQCTFNPGRNRATVEFMFSDGNKEVHKQRPYDFEELEPLLLMNGFTLLELFSWFDRSPYSAKTEKLFCVARRP
jgi:SAM-dependent methyltransferase